MDLKDVRKFKKYVLTSSFLYIIIYYIAVLFFPGDIKGSDSNIWSPIGGALSLIMIGWSIKHIEIKNLKEYVILLL